MCFWEDSVPVCFSRLRILTPSSGHDIVLLHPAIPQLPDLETLTMQAPSFLAAGSVLSTFHHDRYATEALANVTWDATSSNGVALRCIVTARAHLGWTWYVTVESIDGRQVITGGETDAVADAIRLCAVAAATVSVTLYEVQTADGSASYGRHATMELARGAASSRTRLTGDRHRVVTIA